MTTCHRLSLKAIEIFIKSVSGKVLTHHSERARLAVIFFDLNKFKAVNDQHGHLVGDELLRKISVRLSRVAREIDTVSRFGGDEFVVLAQNVKDKKDAEIYVKRLAAVFETPFVIDDKKINMSASFGVSFYPGDEELLPDLLECSDKAMYEAKHSQQLFYFSK